MHTSTQSLNWPLPVEEVPASLLYVLSHWPRDGWYSIHGHRKGSILAQWKIVVILHYYNHCFGASTPLSVVLSSSSSCHCLASLHPQQPLHHHFPLLRPPNTTQAALDRPLHHNTVSTTIQHTWHTYSRHVFHGKDLLSSVPYKCQEVDTVGTVCGEY